MQKNWKVQFDGRNLSTNQIISQIVKNRQISDLESFLHPSSIYLLPFESLTRITKAKDIILDSINKQHNFLIYGDVDTDGCTSAAIVYRYLKNYTNKLSVHINTGKAHGIDDDFDMEKYLTDIDTLIVVDSINDTIDMYQKILSRGIRLIVLDHHVPSKEIEPYFDDICLVSSAVDNYLNPYLSGAGVCWKVMSYIDVCTDNHYAENLVDLACVGILADMCDVSANSMENRYICYRGMNNVQNPALKYLIGNYEFNAQTVSFSIAPMINSANRTENNSESLRLFISNNVREIVELVNRLKYYKEEQKKIVDKIYTEVISEQAKKQLDRKCMCFLVNDAKNFLGLIATKACVDYSRPVIVVGKGDDSYDGSMRSVGVENFLKMINDTGLASSAGHEMAAGVTIPKDNIFPFCATIENVLKDYQFEENIFADVQLSAPQINSYLIKKLKELSVISGTAFPAITVMISDVDNYHVESMSNGKHLNIKTEDLSLIQWNFSKWETLTENKSLEAIGTLDENFFGGKHTNQLILSDFRYK